MDLLEQQEKMREICALAIEAAEARLVKAKINSIGKELSYKQVCKIESEASSLLVVIFEYFLSTNYPKGKSFNDFIEEQCKEFSKKEMDLL